MQSPRFTIPIKQGTIKNLNMPNIQAKHNLYPRNRPHQMTKGNSGPNSKDCSQSIIKEKFQNQLGQLDTKQIVLKSNVFSPLLGFGEDEPESGLMKTYRYKPSLVYPSKLESDELGLKCIEESSPKQLVHNTLQHRNLRDHSDSSQSFGDLKDAHLI